MESYIVNAVGIWFFSQSTRRYLYLLRNDTRHPDNWGLPGGKCLKDESLLDGIVRECQEELDINFTQFKFLPIEKFTSNEGTFVYNTFFCVVDSEFVPRLNDEHQGYAWIDSGVWPRPMHPGLWNTVNLDSVQKKIQLIEKSLDTTNNNSNSAFGTRKVV